MASQNILISSCLIGERVRYDGQHKLVEHAIIKNWLKQGILIPVCPEVAGGLTIPRAPAEIHPSQDLSIQVINIENQDVTREFMSGANTALDICKKNLIQMAMLTEGSPSCGSAQIKNGGFSNIKINGQGITTRLLRENGIQVFNQFQLEQALAFYVKLIS